MTDPSPSSPAGVFTPLSSEEELRLWPLTLHARHLLRKLRYVDYVQAEQDAALLARKLLHAYPASELRRAAFAAIPRGGLIVLGLLAYQLDLQPAQFTVTTQKDSDLLVLVDDCALSGKRLQQELSKIKQKRVAVAQLYSAPGLRSAVQGQYPQVEQCLAAHDLAELPADEEDKLAAHLDGRLYPGPAEIVAFAWNEPDLLVLTPFDDQPAQQWRFLPPHKCLKNRQALGLPPGALPGSSWTVPEGIVYGWFDPLLYLLDTQREAVYRLDGFAAGCWRAIAGYGDADAALDLLNRRYDAVHTQQFEGILQQFAAKRLLHFLSESGEKNS